MRHPAVTVVAALASLALVAPACAAAPDAEGDRREEPSVVTSDGPERAALPDLRIRTLTDGLDHPWDVKPIGDGRLLVTQRERKALTVVDPDGTKHPVAFANGRIWVSGETGLLGLAVDPRFEDNRRFYTCSGWRLDNGRHDIRVIAWTLSGDRTRARRAGTLISGLPIVSGRHGGCRLLVASNGALVVGTGDAAVGKNPRSLTSLGGKVLRLNRMTGRPWPTNPWAKGRGPKRFILTYGHRNVQGLAQRKDGTLWSVEHGSYRDDEINRLVPGGDYGWHPVPGYNESVPMTDQGLPGKQIGARWRSGDPTIAPSGGSFVYGAKWGRLSGAMAVGVLKDQYLMFVKFDDRGRLDWVRVPAPLRQYGRIRAVTQVGGSLYVTTDNGGGTDRVLKITPR